MQTMTDRMEDRSDTERMAACAPRDACEGAAPRPPLAAMRARVNSWLRLVEHGWPQGVPPCSGWGA